MRPAEQRRRRSHYVAALDGLRAFAVLAVIFYHMGLDWAPGGLMGVTIFFVISGYLINGLLVAEYETSGTISLPKFWLRRVRRIIPAVLLALAGTLVLCALVSPALFAKARADLLPSLLFFNNWWQIFHNVSYFEAAAAPSPLTHYWSLAIEEQFYIVWPLLLLALFKLRLPKKAIAAVVAVLAVLSAGEMALMYSPAADPSRIYYGTDTRAASLLIGAFLALVWPSTIFGHRRAQSQSAGANVAFNVMGVAALAGLVVVVVATSSYTPFPYRGGIALVSVLTALLIAVLVVPNTWVARILQLEPFVWIGKRSYGMYLWHYPIILATSRITSTVEVPWWVRIAQIIVIFAISDLSFRFVETPIRSGALRRWWKSRREAKTGTVTEGVDTPSARRSSRLPLAPATIATCAALFCGAIVSLAVMPPATSAVPISSSSSQSTAVVSSTATAIGSSGSSSATANSNAASSDASASGATPSGISTASSTSSSDANASLTASGDSQATSATSSDANSSNSVSASSAESASSSSEPAEASSSAGSTSIGTASTGSESASTSSASSSESASSSTVSSSATSSESQSSADSSAADSSSSASSTSSEPSDSSSSTGASSSAAGESASASNSTDSESSAASTPIAAGTSEEASSADASDASESAQTLSQRIDAAVASKAQELTDEEREAAAAVLSAAEEASKPLTERVGEAVAAKKETLTDEERERAADELLGVIGHAVQTVNNQIDESIKEAERQRREDTYNELFNTEHLNDAGALIFDPLLIGDSVAAGCENEFYRMFPYGHSDAVVSRNIWESPYQFYLENNQVGEYVVFCLGTNNAVVDEQIDEILNIVGPSKKVILVNIRCPRDWEAQTNRAIADAPSRHSNVVAVVDWYGESAGHDEYFYEDGIHVNDAGAKAYIALIQQAIENSIE
ncbi:MAG: acyltransferase [Eggerthellaceae bacterium]|nr:acyltransferase [Eggerthellaceae bacterium]